MMMKSELIDWNHVAGICPAAELPVGEVAREQVERRRRLLERRPEDGREDEEDENDDDALPLVAR